MDILSLLPVIKNEATLQLAKKIVLPLTFLPLLWLVFIKRRGRVRKDDLKIKKPVRGGQDENEEEYNLRNFSLPLLYGWSLRLFSKVAGSAFGRMFILPLTKRNSNLFIFKSMCIEEMPTLYPLVPCDVKAVDVNNGESSIDLCTYLKQNDKSSDCFDFRTISDFVDAYRSKTCTPLDVANRAIAAMETCEDMSPKMRIFIQSSKDAIIEMATASTQRYNDNCPLSVFDGIPVSAKDEFRVAGYYCYEGTPFIGDVLETEDSEAHLVAKLRKGGAIVLGVTNMHQIGMGITGCNPSSRHGTARNPYNPDYYCGGSSSGSGGAVAAGIGPLSLGADGGGSIRIPAAVCGVVGVKATFGRLTATNMYRPGSTVGHPGPLCSTVRDAAISYAFLAGPDPSYKPSMEQPPISLEDFDKTCLEGIKIGIDWTYFTHADQETVKICSQAVKFLENECKAEIVDINIPELEEARVAHFITITTEMLSASTGLLAEHFEEFALDCQCVFGLAESLTSQDFFMAQKQRTRCMMVFEDIFKRVDCVLTPTLATTMAKVSNGALNTGLLDAGLSGQIMRYMFLGNLIGIPSMTVPVGYAEDNLPVGLQVMTKWWDEAMMFRVAHAAEGALQTRNKPQVYFDLL